MTKRLIYIMLISFWTAVLSPQMYADKVEDVLNYVGKTDLSSEILPPKRVLIISTRQITHKSSSDAIVSCINTLQRYYPNCAFDVLELNALSCVDNSYKEKFMPYLPAISAGKYQIVIPVLDKAVEILTEYSSYIPKEVMVVGFSDFQTMVKLRKVHSNTTGLYELLMLEPTLDLALKIFPQAKQIVIVGDTYDSGHAPLSNLDVDGKYRSIPIRVISDEEHTTNQMLDVATQVPFGDILIFCPWRNFSKDGYPSLEYIGDILSTRVRTPFFVLTSALMNGAAIGGRINIGVENGIMLADLVRQCIINGNAGDIPFGFIDSRDVLDEDVMRKFDLKVPRKLENALILNHSQSLFEEYFDVIFLAFIAFVACIVAIVMLLLKRNMQLRTKILHDALPVYFALSDGNGNLSDVHLAAPMARVPKSLSDFGSFIGDIYQEALTKIKNRKLNLTHTQFKSPYTGKYFSAMIKVAPANFFGANRYILVAFDTTEQALNKKRADDMLEQEKIYRTALQMVVENNPIKDVAQYMLNASSPILSADRMTVYKIEKNQIAAPVKLAEYTHAGDGNLFSGGIDKDSNLYKHFLTGEVLIYQSDNVDESKFPPTLLAGMAREDVRSSAMLGVSEDGILSFVVCIEYIARHCKITGAKINFLENIAKIIQLSEQRRDSYEKLLLSQSQNNLIFSHIQSPILLYGAEGNLICVNNAAAKAIGKPIADIKSCADFSKICKKIPFSRDCTVWRVITTKKTISKTIINAGRRYRLTASPVFDSSGRVANVIESAIDVTEIEKNSAELADALIREQYANLSLEKAVAAANDAAKAKGYFLATMSHELRTPLNSIIGYSELTQDPSISEQERIENSRNINFSANLLLQLINDILDLSKIESDKLEIVKSPLNTKVFIEDIVKMFALSASKNGSKICSRVDENIPLLMIDISRLRQILTNLVGNAVKFTTNGIITLEVSYLERILTLKISDNGAGIAPEFLEKIFEPFEQQSVTQATRNCSVAGTGLGLAISQKLAIRMGGKIGVESTLGVGSCFTLTLPNIDEAPNGTIAPLSIADKPYTPVKKASVPKDISVLIVDDVDMNLKVLSSMLKKMGVRHMAVNSGKAAIEVMKKENFQIILTDLWMPEMTGIELAKTVKSSENGRNVKIIAVTADSNVMGGREFFDSVLIKPITVDGVRGAVESNQN